MGAVYFYHLTRSPLEATLRTLLTKSLAAGWRVAVRGRDEALLDRLDAQLWLGDPNAFLPHGRAGGPQDADQPILLTTDAAPAPNAPSCLVSVEGAAIVPAEVAEMARAMVIFDGGDAGAVQTAREQWKALTAAGLAAQYWSEEDGQWQKKAEAGGAVTTE